MLACYGSLVYIYVALLTFLHLLNAYDTSSTDLGPLHVLIHQGSSILSHCINKKTEI